MAFEPSRSWWSNGVLNALSVARANGARLEVAATPFRKAWQWFSSTWLHRFFTATLARRIFAANFLALIALLLSVLYVTQKNSWLIQAKSDSLLSQGEIIAAALAAGSMLDRDGISFPDRLPEIDGRGGPYRDDGFAKLELSLRPDRVQPVLRRLIGPTNTRARVYTEDGTLIADTASMPVKKTDPNPEDRVRTRNAWTRIIATIWRSELPVYREIGSANGTFYKEVRDALLGTKASMVLLSDNYEQIVSIAVPINRKNSILGVLLLSTPPGEIDRIIARERRVILVLAAMALAATLIASWLLRRAVAGPMSRLSSAARQVSLNINARAEIPEFADRTDEVNGLASSFREMTRALYDRIEASEQFAADVAHELKNPLAAASAMAQMLNYAKTDEKRAEVVQQIQGELKRLNRLISDVSNASRLDAELARQETAPLDLRGLLDGVVTMFSDLVRDSGRSVVLEAADVPLLSDGYTVDGHAGRLRQVATNLIDNAISFSPEGGTITVRLIAHGRDVEFAVEDQGPGIPADKLEKVFERFYSDRPQTDGTSGRNSGLGLSISREIVRAHGGRIWAENAPARKGEMPAKQADDAVSSGARFIVRLPKASVRPQTLAWRG
ncbi:MAG TPA: stimulus-sensing domain-containing protein [Hyphomicrobiaceae bacterium]|nr:stimulus-sensing domain-containing protein [Hyphomicrobiaceae bacterium]